MPRCEDPREGFEALRARVVDGPGTTPPAQRAAAAGDGPVSAAGLPAAADPVVERIRRDAHRVTDADLAALRAAGLDEDAIFELTVAAAVGVAGRRLAAYEAAKAAAKAGAGEAP